MSLKRFIRRYWYMIIAALIIICGLIAVAVPTTTKAKAEKKVNRFEIIESAGLLDYHAVYIIQDTVTGEKYIFIDGNSHGCSLCPLIEPETDKSTATKEDIEIPIDDYKAAAEYLAKTVYGEARGCSTTEQAAVIWCILNRVDSRGGYSPKAVIDVVTAKKQFHGYIPSNPVTEEHYDLAIDVLSRWLREKAGETDVGRVLPAEFIYFSGDGKRNHYRTDWRGGTHWDWSLESPYEV